MVFRIRQRDRRQVFEVLSTAESARSDPKACRQLLADGTLKLFEADHGGALVYEIQRIDPPQARVVEMTVAGQIPEPAMTLLREWTATRDPSDSPWLQRTLRLGRAVTADSLSHMRRHRWVEQSGFVQNFFIPSGCGDMLVGHVYTKDFGRSYSLGATRNDPSRPYTDRDRRVFRMMMLECQRRYRQGRFMPLVRPLNEATLSTQEADTAPPPPELPKGALASLTPRENEVLDRLLDGLAPKQIAYQLGLSTHTVYSYTKSLHRKLDVSSRSELLAHFIARPGALSVAG